MKYSKNIKYIEYILNVCDFFVCQIVKQYFTEIRLAHL